MAVAYGSAGAVAYSTGSPAPAYPVSITAGNYLVLFVGTKPDTASTTLPSGWTRLGGVDSTSAVAPGNDVGRTKVTAFGKVADGTETGSLTTVVDANSVTWAQIIRFTNATGYWEAAAATGEDLTGGTTWSATMTSNPGLTAGDMCAVACVIPTDVSTPSQFSLSTDAITAPGVTSWLTTIELSEPDSALGQDIGGLVFYKQVNAGTATGPATVTATVGGTTTNVYGPTILVRLREVPKPPIQGAAALTATSTLGAAQPVVRPVSDISGTWTVTPSGTAAAAIGEAVLDTSSYASTNSDGAGGASILEVALSDLPDPGTDRGFAINMAYQLTDTDGSFDRTACSVALVQGSTTIHEQPLAETGSGTYIHSWSVPEAAAALITDFTDLRLRFTCSDVNSGALAIFTVYQAYVVFPNAVTTVSAPAALTATSALYTAIYTERDSPVIIHANTFDGGTHGTAITVANSGGASGDAWTSVATAGLPKYHAPGLRSKMGMYCAVAANSGNKAAVYALRGSSEDEAFRFYFMVPTAFPATKLTLMDAWRESDSFQDWTVAITPDGKIEFDGPSGLVGTVALSPDTVYRFELRTNSATDRVTYRVYLGDTDTLVESKTTTRSLAVLSQVWVGICTSTSSNQELYIDDVARGHSGWLGKAPAVHDAPLTATSTLSVASVVERPVAAALTATSTLTVEVPTILLANNAEGGTDGVQISQSNSGGESGAQFAAGTSADQPGGSAQWSTLQSARGTKSVRFTLASSGNQYAAWDANQWGGLKADAFFRMYFRRSTSLIGQIVTGHAVNYTSDYWNVSIVAGNFIKATVGATTGTGTHAIAQDAWYRLEIHHCAAPLNVFEIRLFEGHNTTPVDTVKLTGLTLSSLGNVTWGLRNFAAASTMFVDEMAFGTHGWLGAAPPTTFALVPLTATATLAAAVTSTAGGPPTVPGPAALTATSTLTIAMLAKPFLSNSFENGPAGADVTELTSGGPVDDAFPWWWDTAPTFTTDYVVRGAYGMKCTTGAVDTSSLVSWDSSTPSGFAPSTDLTTRAYVQFPAATTATAPFLWINGPNVELSRTAAGNLRMRCSRESTPYDVTSSTVLAADTSYRLEVRYRASVGVEARIFVGHGETSLEVLSGSAENFSVGEVDFGWYSGKGGTLPAGSIVYMDEVALANGGWIGPATPIITAPAALTATSTLTTGVTVVTPVSAALSATSTLAAAGTVETSVGAGLTATSTLSVAAAAEVLAPVALSATSTLTAGVTLIRPVEAALSATSTLSIATFVERLVGVPLTASSTLAAAAALTTPVAAALSATATLSTAVTLVRSFEAALTATSTLAAAVVLERPFVAPLTAASTLAVGLDVAVQATIALTAASGLATAVEVVLPAVVPLMATSTLTTASETTMPAVIALSATSTLSSDTVIETYAAAPLTVVATLGVDVTVIRQAAAALMTTSTLAVDVLASRVAAAALIAASDLTVEISIETFAEAPLTAVSTLTVAITVASTGAIPLTAASTLTAAITISRQLDAALTAASTLVAVVLVSRELEAALATTSTLSVEVVLARPLEAALVATSGLTVETVVSRHGAADLVATATLSSAPVLERPLEVALAAASSLVVGSVVTRLAEIALVAASVLSASSTLARPVAAALTSTATLSVEVTAVGTGAVPLSATSTLAAGVTLTRFVVAPLTSTSTLTTAVTAGRLVAAALTASAALAVETTTQKDLAAPLTATALLAVEVTVGRAAAAVLLAASTLDVIAEILRQAIISLTAASVLGSTVTLTAAPVHSEAVALTAIASLISEVVRERQIAAALVATSSLSAQPFGVSMVTIGMVAVSVLTCTTRRRPSGQPRPMVMGVMVADVPMNIVFAEA